MSKGVKRYTTNEAYALLPYGARVVSEDDYDAVLAEVEALRKVIRAALYYVPEYKHD